MRSDCSIAHRDAYHILNLFDTNATPPLQVELFLAHTLGESMKLQRFVRHAKRERGSHVLHLKHILLNTFADFAQWK